MDCFKVLLLDFVITCLIVLADTYVLIYWKLPMIHDKLYVGIVHMTFITYET